MHTYGQNEQKRFLKQIYCRATGVAANTALTDQHPPAALTQPSATREPPHCRRHVVLCFVTLPQAQNGHLRVVLLHF